MILSVNVTNVIMNKEINMDIPELVEKLEFIINNKMDEFKRLGAEWKQIQNDAIQRIEVLQSKMRDIAVELNPVQYIVNQNNPDFKEIFDILMVDFQSSLKG